MDFDEVLWKVQASVNKDKQLWEEMEQDMKIVRDGMQKMKRIGEEMQKHYERLKLHDLEGRVQKVEIERNKGIGEEDDRNSSQGSNNTHQPSAKVRLETMEKIVFNTTEIFVCRKLSEAYGKVLRQKQKKTDVKREEREISNIDHLQQWKIDERGEKLKSKKGGRNSKTCNSEDGNILKKKRKKENGGGEKPSGGYLAGWTRYWAKEPRATQKS